MKNTDLLSAIGQIDDRYIITEASASNAKSKKTVFNVIKVAVAAVFCAGIIGGLWLISYKNVIAPQTGTDSESVLTAETDAASEEATKTDVNEPDEIDADVLMQSFEEFLGGRLEANKYSATEREITYKNRVEIDFCVKLDAFRYAAVYGTAGKAAEDVSDTFVDIAGYRFRYKNGRRLYLVDGGAAIPAENSNLSGIEAKTVYDAYTKYVECMQRHWLGSAMRDCFMNGEGEYNGYYLSYAFWNGDLAIGIFSYSETEAKWTETVAGLDFVHYNDREFYVLKSGKSCYGLQNAYDSGLITLDDIDQLYESYTGSLIAAAKYTTLEKTNEFSVNFGDGEGEIGHLENMQDIEKLHGDLFIDNGYICIVDAAHRRINRYDENGNIKGYFSSKNSETKSLTCCVPFNNAYYTVEDGHIIYRYYEEDKPELVYEGGENESMRLSCCVPSGSDFIMLYKNGSEYKYYTDGSKEKIDTKQRDKDLTHFIFRYIDAQFSYKIVNVIKNSRAIVEIRYSSEPLSKSHICYYWATGSEIASYTNGDEGDIYAGACYVYDNGKIYALNIKEDKVTVVCISIVITR